MYRQHQVFTHPYCCWILASPFQLQKGRDIHWSCEFLRGVSYSSDGGKKMKKKKEEMCIIFLIVLSPWYKLHSTSQAGLAPLCKSLIMLSACLRGTDTFHSNTTSWGYNHLLTNTSTNFQVLPIYRYESFDLCFINTQQVDAGEASQEEPKDTGFWMALGKINIGRRKGKEKVHSVEQDSC